MTAERRDREFKPPNLLKRLLRALRPSKPDHRAGLIARLPKGARGVEIGVWKGDFSARLLALADPAELHLVDPWRFQPQYPKRMYGGKSAKAQDEMDAIHESVCARFAAEARVRVFRGDAAAFFASGVDALDWAYIDGDHSEAAVYADLALCFDHVRAGGLVTGDDFLGKDADGRQAVRAAVERFCAERAVQFDLIGDQFAIARP